MPPPFPDPAPNVPRMLPIRLLRRPAPLLFSFVFGSILILLGGGIWWGAHSYLTAENSFTLVDTLSGIFIFIGLLFLWSCLYQVRRKLMPPTVAEISTQTLDRSRPFKFTLIQPGAVKWSLLEARLVCLDRQTTFAEHSDGEAYEKVKEKKLHDIFLIQALNLRVAKGQFWNEEGEFTFPQSARVSSRTRDADSNTKGIVWKILVRGKGPFLGGFIHEYEVRVV